MLINTTNGGDSYHFLFDFPQSGLGSKYSSLDKLLDLVKSLYNSCDKKLPIEISDTGVTCNNKSDAVLFCKCIYGFAIALRKQGLFISDTISREMKLQKELAQKDSKKSQKKNNKIEQVSSGFMPKRNALESAIHLQIAAPRISDQNAQKFLGRMVSEHRKPEIKRKTEDQIYHEINIKMNEMIALTDWLKPNNDLEEALIWIELLIDIFDQLIGSEDITDIDDLKFAEYSLKRESEVINCITMLADNGLPVMPKELKNKGFMWV